MLTLPKKRFQELFIGNNDNLHSMRKIPPNKPTEIYLLRKKFSKAFPSNVTKARELPIRKALITQKANTLNGIVQSAKSTELCTGTKNSGKPYEIPDNNNTNKLNINVKTIPNSV